MPQHEIEQAVVTDSKLTREQIGKWLKNDLDQAFLVLDVVRSQPQVFESILDVYWNRYQLQHQQQSLNFEPKEKGE